MLGLGGLFKQPLDGAERAQAQQQLDEAFASARVLIFGRISCPRCVEAQNLLSSLCTICSEQALPICTIRFFEFDEQQHESLRDLITEVSGGKTVPRIFIDQRFVGGCDDLQELDCANMLSTIVASENPEVALNDARPSRTTWPEEATVTVKFKGSVASLVVDAQWQHRLLKRRACEVLHECTELPDQPELLMLCEMSPFPLLQPVGAHRSLNDGAVITLIDRRTYRANEVDYTQF